MNPIKLIEKLARQLRMIAARCVITLIDDSGGLQAVQVGLLSKETRNLQSMGHYGLASHPRQGAEALAVFLGGQRDHGVVIAVEDRRYRLKGLSEGEVALYTDEGDAIHMKRGGVIKVSAGSRVLVDAPNVDIVSDVAIVGHLSVAGEITDAAGSMSSMRAIYNSHTHVENGGAGPTDPPGGQM